MIPNYNTELYAYDLHTDDRGRMIALVERPVVGWAEEAMDDEGYLMPVCPGPRERIPDLLMDKSTGMTTRIATGRVYLTLETALDAVCPGAAETLQQASQAHEQRLAEAEAAQSTESDPAPAH